MKLMSRLAILLVGAITASGLPVLAVQAPKVTAEPIIELPKFEVSDTRILPPLAKWHYASIPGFEILSSTSARETKRFVQDFLLLQSGINEIMPGFTGANVAVPTSLILTGRGNDYARFVPTERGDDRYRTNSLFFDDPERGAIIVDFAAYEILGDDNTYQEADPYRGFYKEYFRYLIRRRMGAKPPAWFEEGFVQLFASIDVNKKWINFAMIGDGFGGERSGDFNRLLARQALLSMPELFAGPPAERRQNWEAQSYAFVHMCLYGRGQRYQKGFLKFVGLIGEEPPTEETFKACFGLSFKDMLMEIRGYIDFTDYKSTQFIAKKGQALPDPPPFTLRDATDSESGRMVGEALRLGGHPDEAQLALIAPYIRGEREPNLLAALGLAERLAGKNDRARKFLEAAAKAKAERPRAYLELGRMNFEEVSAQPSGADKKLSEAQVARVLAPLEIARKQRPPMAQLYSLMAEVWLKSARRPTQEEFRTVVEGPMTFPTSIPLVWRTTLLAAEWKFEKEALALAQHGVRISRDSGARNQFELVAAAFQRDAEAAPPAAAPTKKSP